MRDFRFHRILALTNFTSYSANGTLYAAGLAEQLDAKLTLYNSIGPAPMVRGARAFTAFRYLNRALALAMKRLRQSAQRFELEEVQLVAKVSFLVSGVLEEIKADKIDLLVIGLPAARRQRKASVRHILPLLEQSPCPVLLVQSDIEYVPPIQVLFPVRLAPGMLEKTFPVIALTRTADANIQLMGLYSKYRSEDYHSHLENQLQLCSDALQRNGVQHQSDMVSAQKSPKIIAAEASRREADMVAVVIEKLGFWRKIFQKPLFQLVLEQAAVPVLAIPPAPENTQLA